MISIHLTHAAGMAKTLEMFDIEIIQAKANQRGVQLITSTPVPAELSDYVEAISEHGEFIFGVWVKKQEKHDGE